MRFCSRSSRLRLRCRSAFLTLALACSSCALRRRRRWPGPARRAAWKSCGSIWAMTCPFFTGELKSTLISRDAPRHLRADLHRHERRERAGRGDARGDVAARDLGGLEVDRRPACGDGRIEDAPLRRRARWRRRRGHASSRWTLPRRDPGSTGFTVALQPGMTILIVRDASGADRAAHLRAFFSARGDRVVRLVRRAAVGDDEIEWDPGRRHALDGARLEGVDAVIHLVGRQHRRRALDARRASASCATAALLVDGPPGAHASPNAAPSSRRGC